MITAPVATVARKAIVKQHYNDLIRADTTRTLTTASRVPKVVAHQAPLVTLRPTPRRVSEG